MTTTPETNPEVAANCNMIRQLKWLQREYWDSYDYQIKKLVEANETLLKSEQKREAKEQESKQNATS